MLQGTIRKALKRIQDAGINDLEIQYRIIVEYWNAIRRVFPEDWRNHRHTLLTKGVGLYALMELLGDLVSIIKPGQLSEEWFAQKLKLLLPSISWSSRGMFSNVGGKKGAHEVYHTLKEIIFK